MSVNKSDGIRARVVYESRQAPHRFTGATGRWFKAMTEALDSHSFEPYTFAYVLSNTHVSIQRGFLRLVVIYVGILAEKFEAGLFLNEDERMVMQDGHLISKHVSFLDDN